MIIKGSIKNKFELLYWNVIRLFDKNLSNQHYKKFFTEYFGLTEESYYSKKILDIGCGPRGSLEWNKNSKISLGLDPLADKYFRLNPNLSVMNLVKANAEKIPFKDSEFDIVTSFNSLDHVDEIDKTVFEIKRITKKGGLFLLITDCCHKSTLTEPQSFGWEIVEKFYPEFEAIEVKKLEKFGTKIYKSIEKNKNYDFSNPKNRYGVLIAKFIRL